MGWLHNHSLSTHAPRAGALFLALAPPRHLPSMDALVTSTQAELRSLGHKRKKELRRLVRFRRALMQGAGPRPHASMEDNVAGLVNAQPSHKTIHVASDCSGIGIEILALESIPCLAGCVVHEFASESDPSVRRVLAYNSPHVKHVSAGCASCEHTEAGNIDLYFNMSPCPAALMGEQDTPPSLHNQHLPTCSRRSLDEQSVLRPVLKSSLS